MRAESWRTIADAVTDAELAEFQRICVRPGHIGTAMIGTCSRCGGATSSSSMSLCRSCAHELGVCPFDQRLTGWRSHSVQDPDGLAARWLALLQRGYAAERAAAQRALAGWPNPEVAAAARALEQHTDLPVGRRSPATAEFVVGFHDQVPGDVVVGARWLDAPVVEVHTALRYALVRPADAAQLEALAIADPRVDFVELNRATAELEG